MPTVIDELVLRLGLDSKKFNEDQRRAVDEAKKAQTELQKAGTQQEKMAKSIGESFAAAQRHAIEFFGVLLGAHGLKELIADLTTSDAALGRLAANLNMSPQVLGAWQMAAERAGGSAEATASSIERIGKALYDLHTSGQRLPDEFYRLEALTGKQIDPNHGAAKVMLDLASAGQALYKIDPTRAHFLLQGLGLDEGTSNAIFKNGDKIIAYLKDLNKYQPTDATIKSMQELQDSWVTLQQSAYSLANTLWGALAPALDPILKQLTAWIDANHEFITDQMLTGVHALVTYLQNVDWPGIGSGLMTVVNALASILGMLPSAQNAANGGNRAIDPGKNTFWSFQDQFETGQGPLGAGALPPQKDIADMVRKAAWANNINPDLLMKNYGAEGASGYVGDDGSSFGPFQFHYGGLSSKYPGAGLGDDFTKATGLDARDPSTIAAQADWYAKYVRKHGWGASMGMKKLGYTGMEGLGSNLPAANSVQNGTRLSNIQNNYPTTTSSSSVAMHVNEMNISTQASHPETISQDIIPALRRQLRALSFDPGPA